MIRPGDVVLEPSAGTGMLAVMAQLALGNGAAGALHLNEIAATRAGLLAGLFPGSTVTRHNAESIRDRLPELRPTVVLMNPPFSASPGVERIRHHADLHHLRSAFSMLPPGGRLVAISSAHCVPGDAAWEDAFASLEPPAGGRGRSPQAADAACRRPEDEQKESAMTDTHSENIETPETSMTRAFAKAGYPMKVEGQSIGGCAGSDGTAGSVALSVDGETPVELEDVFTVPQPRTHYRGWADYFIDEAAVAALKRGDVLTVGICTDEGDVDLEFDLTDFGRAWSEARTEM